MKPLSEIVKASKVHQIVLSHGEVDNLPHMRIADLKSKMSENYTLWTEEKILELLRTEFPPEVLAAYTKLKPLAFKADLARYCIIYTYGGLYIDLLATLIDTTVLDQLNSDDSDVILFRDVPMAKLSYVISNTIFWFKEPKHEILHNLIFSVVENINTKRYGSHFHSVTGPIAFGEEVVKYQLSRDSSTILIGDTTMDDWTPFHTFNSTEIAYPLKFSSRRPMNSEYENEVPSGYESGTKYYQMWLDRDIFY